MLRVAQVVPYSWSIPGGVRSHVTGLAGALRARGVEVDIIAPCDGKQGFPGLHCVGGSFPVRDNGSVVPVALGPRAAVRTSRLLRSGRYDLVHLHEPMIPLVCLTALLRADVPLVGTFHMYAAGPRWYRPFAPLCTRALGRLSARIAVSEAAREHVARTCPGSYRVIPNGVDVALFSGAAGVRSGSRIAFVGRAEPRKGLPVLLEAFKRLPGDVTLDLAGVDARALHGTRIRLTGDEQRRVRALGYVGERERALLLGRADVLCVPSLQGESFGIVLLEGMASGAAVVASDVVGYRDVLPRTCGRLVPPGDAGALAETLEEVLADTDLRARLARNAREEVGRYDWSVVAGEIIEVYADVLGLPLTSLAARPAAGLATGSER